MVLFLTSVDSNLVDISLAGLGSERRSQIMLFPKVKKKSDTVVALRRSLSLILRITLVSFINVYYEYFCKITECFGIIMYCK